MLRLIAVIFILVVALFDGAVLAQRGRVPSPPYRPPVRPGVGSSAGGWGTGRPTVSHISRPPRWSEPARRQAIPGGRAAPALPPGQRRGSSAGSAAFKAPIPPPRSPQVDVARTQTKAALAQLRTSLRARLRSSTALKSTLVPAAKSVAAIPELDGILQNATLIRAGKGKQVSGIYEKAGGFKQAAKDFESLTGETRTIADVKVKELSDKSKAILRRKSDDGRPTLEIQHAAGVTTKIRYK